LKHLFRLLSTAGTLPPRPHRGSDCRASKPPRRREGFPSLSGWNLQSVGWTSPMIIWLVVEPTPLKNMKVKWDDEIPNIMEK